WDLLRNLGIGAIHVDTLLASREPRRALERGDETAHRAAFVVGDQLSAAANDEPQATDRGLYDVVVDCTGQPSGLIAARRLLRPRGRLVLKSTFASESTLNLSALVVDEVQLLGSRCGPFAPALRLLERDLIATEPMIEGRFALRDGLSAFRAAAGRLKILLEV